MLKYESYKNLLHIHIRINMGTFLRGPWLTSDVICTSYILSIKGNITQVHPLWLSACGMSVESCTSLPATRTPSPRLRLRWLTSLWRQSIALQSLSRFNCKNNGQPDDHGDRVSHLHHEYLNNMNNDITGMLFMKLETGKWTSERTQTHLRQDTHAYSIVDARMNGYTNRI